MACFIKSSDQVQLSHYLDSIATCLIVSTGPFARGFLVCGVITIFIVLCAYLRTLKRQPRRMIMNKATDDLVTIDCDEVREAADTGIMSERLLKLLYDNKAVGIFRKNTKYRGALLAMAKAKWPLLTRDSANYQMVWKYLSENMRDHGVRPSHAANMLPQLVELVFRPSRAQMWAKACALSQNHVNDMKIHMADGETVEGDKVPSMASA